MHTIMQDELDFGAIEFSNPALYSSNLKPQKREYDCIGAAINDSNSKHSIWHCFHIFTQLDYMTIQRL